MTAIKITANDLEDLQKQKNFIDNFRKRADPIILTTDDHESLNAVANSIHIVHIIYAYLQQQSEATAE